MLRTVTLWILFVPTIVIVSLILLLPAVFLHPISLKLSRRYTAFVSASWFTWFTVLLRSYCGIKFLITGDVSNPIDKSKHAIIISNHGSWYDQLYTLGIFLRFGCITQPQFVSSARFNHFPLTSWVLQLHHYIFINKKWIDDKEYIADSLRYLSETGPPVHLQVFPEGTILSKANKERAHEYSEKNGLQKFDYVLNPRIKGFVQMVSTLRETGEVDVYDFTTGYVGKYDVATFFGTLPKEVHHHVKHYPSSSLPSSDEGLSDWLKERWVEKEERLANFYQSHSFPGPIFQDGWRTKALMIAAFIKWLVLYALMMFSLIQVPFVTTGILVVSSAIHYIVNKWMDGWDKVAIRKWKKKRSITQ